MRVEGVDLDALQLNEGEIIFELPGDETLQVYEAVFPWFGGVLGVYEAQASFDRTVSVMPMRIDNVDLAQVLEYVDIEGLSGEGRLSGVLPLSASDGRARIDGGVLKSDGPGAIRYVGKSATEAVKGNEQARVAFNLVARSSL